MQTPEFTYLPKGESVCCLKSSRRQGHTPAAIHMHDHDELLFITSPCRCRVVNNGTSLWVQGPAVLRHAAGTFHEIVEILGEYHARVVFFHPQVLEGLPEQLQIPTSVTAPDLLVQPLTEAQRDDFLPLLELLARRPISQKLPLLLCVLEQTARVLDAGAASISTRQSYVFDAVELLQERPEEKHTLADMAQRFHVSQTKLKTDFRRITGVSLKTFHTRVRIRKAMVLLRTTAREQAAVAAACGFADESHFIDAFRKACGTTPGQWRRQQT